MKAIRITLVLLVRMGIGLSVYWTVINSVEIQDQLTDYEMWGRDSD